MKQLKIRFFASAVITLLTAGQCHAEVEPFTSSGLGSGSDPGTEIQSLFSYQDILERTEKHSGTSPRFNRALRNIASLMSDNKDFANAERILMRALKLANPMSEGQVTDQVECLSALAELNAERGELNRAKSFALECIDLMQENSNIYNEDAYRNSPEDYAWKFQQLGIIETKLKEFADAEKHFQVAINILEKADFSARKAEAIGKAKQKMAWCCGKQGRIDDASKLYEESIKLFDEADGPKRKYNFGDDFLFEYASLLESADRRDEAEQIRMRIRQREESYSGIK